MARVKGQYELLSIKILCLLLGALIPIVTGASEPYNDR